MSVQALGWVLDYSEARGLDRLVLLVIANSAEPDGSRAWPSIATIAAKTRLSRRTVQRCIERLTALGELAVEQQAGGTPGLRGDRRPNAYTVIMHRGAAAQWDTGRQPDTPSGATGCQADTPSTVDGVSQVTGRGVTADAQDVLDPSFKELTTTPQTPQPGKPGANGHPAPSAQDFDLFWAAYPRRADKLKARPVFGKQARAHGAAVIIAGARRFAADPNLPPTRYIPYPATWLNAGGWDNEPLPPRGSADDDGGDYHVLVSE